MAKVTTSGSENSLQNRTARIAAKGTAREAVTAPGNCYLW